MPLGLRAPVPPLLVHVECVVSFRGCAGIHGPTLGVALGGILRGNELPRRTLFRQNARPPAGGAARDAVDVSEQENVHDVRAAILSTTQDGGRLAVGLRDDVSHGLGDLLERALEVLAGLPRFRQALVDEYLYHTLLYPTFRIVAMAVILCFTLSMPALILVPITIIVSHVCTLL